MELLKKNIYMNRKKCRASLQLTIDDDLIVPDSKPDMSRLLKTDGEIKLNDYKVSNNKLYLNGALLYRILYVCEGGSSLLSVLNGEVPFDEVVNLDEACNHDDINLSWEFEDLSARMIHSRKFSLRSLLRLTVSADELTSHEAVIDVVADSDTFYKKNSLSLTGIAVNRHDTQKFHSELMLPNNKPEINELLYYELVPMKIESRLMPDRFALSGELSLFLCYLGTSDDRPLVCYETDLPLSLSVECPGCREDLIPYINHSICEHSLVVRPDADGEERKLEADLSFDFHIKLYEEYELATVQDIYSPKRLIAPVLTPVKYETLLLRNNGKIRLNEQNTLPQAVPNVMQLCHVSTKAALDSLHIENDGILAEGAVDGTVFYITDEDTRPLELYHFAIPFSELIEVRGITETCLYEVKAAVEQATVSMLDANIIEVKLTLGLDTIVFESHTEPFITELIEEPIDTEELESRPSMVGYPFQAGDTLWDIAKRYHSSVESIRKVNRLPTEEPEPGNCLLIVKIS